VLDFPWYLIFSGAVIAFWWFFAFLNALLIGFLYGVATARYYDPL
jgi:hypothetical protein